MPRYCLVFRNVITKDGMVLDLIVYKIYTSANFYKVGENVTVHAWWLIQNHYDIPL